MFVPLDPLVRRLSIWFLLRSTRSAQLDHISQCRLSLVNFVLLENILILQGPLFAHPVYLVCIQSQSGQLRLRLAVYAQLAHTLIVQPLRHARTAKRGLIRMFLLVRLLVSRVALANIQQ